MPNITENYQYFKNIVEDTYKSKLLVVSKNFSPTQINEAYQAGARNFGENRVQELLSKYMDMQITHQDIKWNLIGTLQTNKAKYITDFVSLVHSIDKVTVLQEINKHAKKHDRIQDCLLQIHIAQESTKYGLSYQEAEKLLQHEDLEELKNIRIVGLMGMATFTDDNVQIQKEFKGLRTFFEELKKLNNKDYPFLQMKELSMGMSSDYQIALDEGSTIIRIGRGIFEKKS